MRKTDKKYFEKMVEDKDLVKESFNTDDGIRRAAISWARLRSAAFRCFNTDDGIRRAAIKDILIDERVNYKFQYR